MENELVEMKRRAYDNGYCLELWLQMLIKQNRE